MTIIVDKFRAPGTPRFKIQPSKVVAIEKPPFKEAEPGTIRGPFYPEHSNQRFMVKGRNGWLPVTHMVGHETEDECRARVEQWAKEATK
jgi:hypothetical protein